MTQAGEQAQTRPMINNPQWKLLTSQVYSANIDNTLFCRLVTYENKNFGIVPMQSLNAPVFDEFFLLQPAAYTDNAVQLLAPPPASRVLIDQVSTAATEAEKSFSSDLYTMEPAEYQDDSIPLRKLERSDLDRVRRVGMITVSEGGGDRSLSVAVKNIRNRG